MADSQIKEVIAAMASFQDIQCFTDRIMDTTFESFHPSEAGSDQSIDEEAASEELDTSL